MATPNNETQCATCKTHNATSRCLGCAQDFCFDHLGEHRQQLNRKLDQIEQDWHFFQQTTNSQKRSLIEQVDQWEHKSIEKIKETAQEIREILSIYSNENLNATKLNQLTEKLKQSREQSNATEHDLSKWKEELEQLTKQTNKISNMIIQQTQTPLINKIQVQFSGKQIFLKLVQIE